jgi:hypothetical protein
MTDATSIQIDIEALKLFGSILALFISTVTVQFKLAGFINKLRDEFPNRSKGRWATFGDVYDWAWCYALGVLVNLMFLAIAWKLRSYTIDTDYSLVGTFLAWIYGINFALWCVGVIVDAKRLKHPGKKPGVAA